MASIASSNATATTSAEARHKNNLRLSVLEFIETESAYTKYLRLLAQSDFQQVIRTKCGQTFSTKRTFSERISTLLPQLLDWWSALLFLHEDLDAELQQKCFLRDKNKKIMLTSNGEKKMDPNSQSYLLSAFAKRAHFLKAYSEYCRLHPIVMELVKEERNESEMFDEMVKHFEQSKSSEGLKLASFLIKPIQRVCKYPLLLRELERNTKKSGAAQDPLLAKAISIVDEAVTAVNASQHIQEDTNELVLLQESLRPVNFVNLFLNLIRKSRKLVKRGDLKVYRAVPAKHSLSEPNATTYNDNNNYNRRSTTTSMASPPPPTTTSSTTPPQNSTAGRRSSGLTDFIAGRRRKSSSGSSLGGGSSSNNTLSPQKSPALVPISHISAEEIHVILLSDLLLFTRRVVKPKTLLRRVEKTRYHISEIVSLLDGKVSKTIPPIVGEKGLNMSSTFTFTSKAGDMWCMDVMKSPAKIRDEWVEAIEKTVKAHKELTDSIKVTAEKRKSLVNNRGSGNIGQMVKPSVPSRDSNYNNNNNAAKISNKRNSNTGNSNKPAVPDRSLKKALRKNNAAVVTLYCPKCNQKVNVVQGKAILQCHSCKDLFVVRYEKTKKFYYAESIVHHGMLEYKSKTIYALLTTNGNGGGMLRWFKNQEALVKNGCDASLGKVPIFSTTFICHDETPCRRINQGGFTIKETVSQGKNGLGNRMTLLRQKYESRTKNTSFAALNKQTRDLWVNHILSVIGHSDGGGGGKSGGATEEEEDLLTNFNDMTDLGNSNDNHSNNKNNNNHSNSKLSFAERMQMGEDPSKVIAEMYGRRR